MSRINSNLSGLRTHIASYENHVRDRVETIVTSVVEEAEQEMIRVINTSGTGWVGKGAQAIPQGRVDTGHMRESVGHQTTVLPKRVIGYVGWDLAGKPADEYFLEQEYGFVNPWTGNNVPPMMALWQASKLAQDLIEKELRSARF